MDGDPFGLLGNVLDGKFRVDALVGDGELTVVYKGYDLGVKTPVAIKCLHLPETLDQTLTRPVVEAFEDAGRLYTRFGRGNTHIARIIAAGRTRAPRTGATVPYRVREWFEGESLSSDLARRRSLGEKPRTVPEAFALLSPAIDGIAQAHEEGIAHLTLSPSNLFLARGEGQTSLRVLDFGIARASDHAEGRPTLDSEVTRGLHLLHPAYAAPEQLDMEVGEPGPWTDVYALALIMMEVLAERSEVERRDTPALVSRALDKHKRPTPEAHGLKLPRALDRVLTRAVARSPEARPKNAGVFLNELKAALGQGAPRTQPPRLPPPVAAPAPVAPSRVPSIAASAPVAPPQPLFVAASAPVTPPQAPSAAASGPIASALVTEALPSAQMASPPSFVSLPGALRSGLVDLGQKFARRFSSSRAFPLRVGIAALASAGMVAAFLVFALVRHPSTRSAAAPSAVTTIGRASMAPVEPLAAASLADPPVAAPVVAAVAPAVAAPPTAARAAPEPPANSAPPVARASVVRFSWTDAQRAVHSVKRKVAQCRHGSFWGSGYASVEFTNDGRVHQVLVDPPFSMTVTGKCVADALRPARIHSFVGRNGYYRFRFYIAPR